MISESRGAVWSNPNPMSLVLLAVVLAIIVDIARRDVKVAPKWAWMAATVFLFPVGPILYFLWGRMRISRGLSPSAPEA